MKQGLVRLLYNLGKWVDITHDNVCSSMLSCFYSHLLSTGRPISSLSLIQSLIQRCQCHISDIKGLFYCATIAYHMELNANSGGSRHPANVQEK